MKTKPTKTDLILAIAIHADSLTETAKGIVGADMNTLTKQEVETLWKMVKNACEYCAMCLNCHYIDSKAKGAGKRWRSGRR